MTATTGTAEAPLQVLTGADVAAALGRLDPVAVTAGTPAAHARGDIAADDRRILGRMGGRGR